MQRYRHNATVPLGIGDHPITAKIAMTARSPIYVIMMTIHQGSFLASIPPFAPCFVLILFAMHQCRQECTSKRTSSSGCQSKKAEEDHSVESAACLRQATANLDHGQANDCCGRVKVQEHTGIDSCIHDAPLSSFVVAAAVAAAVADVGHEFIFTFVVYCRHS